MDKFYTVTELAEEFGITRTIRFYETKELLTPQRAGSTRVYTYRDRGRLKLILRAKRLGFSLADVREYIDLYDVDPDQAEQQILLIKKVRARVAELMQQREDLEATLDELAEIESQAIENLKSRGIDPEVK